MRKAILSALLLVGVCAAAFAQTEFDLRLNLKKGDKYTYSVNNNSPTVMSAMGQTFEIKQNQTITYTFTVLDKKDGQYLIQINLDRFQMSVNQMGEEMNADTDSDSKDPMHQELRKLVNVPVQCWFDEDFRTIGEPTAAEGVSAETISAVMRTAMRPTFYKMNIAQAQPLAIKEAPLSKNEEGESFDGILTLLGVSDTDFTINCKGEAVAKMEGTDISGNTLDNIIIDRKSGMVKSSFGTSSLKGKTNMQGTMVDLTVNSIITIRLL